MVNHFFTALSLSEPVAVIEQSSDEASLGLFLFLTAADGIVVDDVGIKILFGAVENGVGTVAAVSRVCQTAGIDQIDAAEILTHWDMGMSETGGDTVLLFGKIEQVVVIITGPLQMAVGDEQFSGGSFHDFSVRTRGTVAVSFYTDYGDSQGIFEGMRVSLVVSAVNDQINMIQFSINLIDLVQKSVGIAQ